MGWYGGDGGEGEGRIRSKAFLYCTHLVALVGNNVYRNKGVPETTTLHTILVSIENNLFKCYEQTLTYLLSKF